MSEALLPQSQPHTDALWAAVRSIGYGTDYAAASAITLVAEYRQKGGIEDLNDARWFLLRLIEIEQSEGGEPLPQVASPPHYAVGQIQPIDLIVSLGLGRDFFTANVIKYVARYRLKGGLADLAKALDYLDRLIVIEAGLNPAPAGEPAPEQPVA